MQAVGGAADIFVAGHRCAREKSLYFFPYRSCRRG